MSNDNKGKVLILIVIVLILLTLSTVLLLVFRPIDGEEKIFEEQYGSGNRFLSNVGNIFTKEEFKKIKSATAEELESYQKSESNAAIGNYKIPDDLEMVSTGKVEYDDINAAIYAIAKEAINGPGVKNIPEEYRDPLMILAQSLTEFNGRQDAKKTWVPAIPSKYMNDNDITIQSLDTWNIAKSLSINEYRSKGNSGGMNNNQFQGPLQLAPGYGVSNNPSWTSVGLKYKSETANIAAEAGALANYNRWAGRNTKLRDHVQYPNKGDLGDRHNWNDASLIAVQVWDYYYGRMKEERTSHIKSSSSVIAAIAANHNIGQSVMDSNSAALTRKLSSLNNICNRSCNYGDLWDYIEAFSDPGVESDLRALAKEKVVTYKRTGGFSHATPAEFTPIAQRNSSSNPILGKLNLSPRREKVHHVYKMVVHYYVLQELYYKGADYK